MGFFKDLLISIAQKTSWERTLFPEPDKLKRLESLTQVIEKQPQTLKQRVATPTMKKETISSEEMLTYQKKQLYGQLWLLQGHAANGSRIEDKPCDCLLKHSIAVAALAEETQPMDPSNHLWAEIKDFANAIMPKAQVAEVIKGTYTSEYPQMASQARELRKRIELGITPLSLEEAKAEAAKLAAQEVEKVWKEVPQ